MQSSCPVFDTECAYRFIVASSSMIGQADFGPREVNQDRYWNEDLNIAGNINARFIGVADGHGMNGHDVAELVRTTLPGLVAIQSDFADRPVTALSKAHSDMDAIMKKSEIETTYSGTTSTSVLIFGNRLLCASVGDSRAILGYSDEGIDWSLKSLSRDHKPDDPVEKARIIAHGGRVMSYQGANGSCIGPQRVWLKDQDSPGLAMSRSFGDGDVSSVGVSAEAEITEHTLSLLDKIVVVASDGVWECLSNEEVMDIVSPHYGEANPQVAVEQLFARAKYRWKVKGDVIDDITAVILFRYPQ